ncbi:MAG: hypothetical protein M3275_06400 [Thermoproteota archaeon]|nr:hypothetical protein [Thermoproteota archaeon]
MTNPVEERIEIEVLEWDPYSNSFTTEGGIDPRLDNLIKEVAIIRLLVLTQDGKPIAQIENIRLRKSQYFYQTPRVQTDVKMPPIQTTDYYYERLL